MLVDVTTYYLEMTDPADLRPKRVEDARFEIKRAEIPLPTLNRFFYTTVGGDWYWTNRLNWSDRQWRAWADRPELRTWVAYFCGTPVGYFELEAQKKGNVEIAYFGLLPQFVGQGFGGPLLTAAIEQAWAMEAQRVWVHTCSLDHPHALANYQARGMRLYQQEATKRRVPEAGTGTTP